MQNDRQNPHHPNINETLTHNPLQQLDQLEQTRVQKIMRSYKTTLLITQ